MCWPPELREADSAVHSAQEMRMTNAFQRSSSDVSSVSLRDTRVAGKTLFLGESARVSLERLAFELGDFRTHVSLEQLRRLV